MMDSEEQKKLKTNNPKDVAFKLGPGQGKSIIALLIACYYVNDLNYSVSIIVPYRALEKQYKELLRKLCPDVTSDNIEVIVTKYLSLQEQVTDVVLVDEADYVVENQTFIWRHEPKKGTPQELNGLYAVAHAKKLIMMSASFDKQQELLLRQAYGI